MTLYGRSRSATSVFPPRQLPSLKHDGFFAAAHRDDTHVHAWGEIPDLGNKRDADVLAVGAGGGLPLGKWCWLQCYAVSTDSYTSLERCQSLSHVVQLTSACGARLLTITTCLRPTRTAMPSSCSRHTHNVAWCFLCSGSTRRCRTLATCYPLPRSHFQSMATGTARYPCSFEGTATTDTWGVPSVA